MPDALRRAAIPPRRCCLHAVLRRAIFSRSLNYWLFRRDFSLPFDIEREATRMLLRGVSAVSLGSRRH